MVRAHHRADIIASVVVGQKQRRHISAKVISRTKETPLYSGRTKLLRQHHVHEHLLLAFLMLFCVRLRDLFWNVTVGVALLLLLGRFGTVVVVVFVTSFTSSVFEAAFGAAAALLLSFLLFVLKDDVLDIFVHNKKWNRKRRGECRGVVGVL